MPIDRRKVGTIEDRGHAVTLCGDQEFFGREPVKYLGSEFSVLRPENDADRVRQPVCGGRGRGAQQRAIPFGRAQRQLVSGSECAPLVTAKAEAQVGGA